MIKISILCMEYNQSAYIREALNSFVHQKTDFEFEILVHDDASNDGTQDIVKQYAEKYPNLVKVIYEEENQYSKGVNILEDIMIPRASGKYVALCEGDDYWIDQFKLQKQYEAMEKHEECDICACAAYTVDAEGNGKIGTIAPYRNTRIIPMENVIKGGGLYVATAGLMFRKSLFMKKYAFREYYQLDYTLQMMGSLRGGMLYIADVMVAYRIAAASSWTLNVRHDPEKYIINNNKIIRSLRILDSETQGKYKDSISIAIKEHMYESLAAKEDYKSIWKDHRELIQVFPIKKRLWIFCQAYFPCLITLNGKIKQKMNIMKSTK